MSNDDQRSPDHGGPAQPPPPPVYTGQPAYPPPPAYALPPTRAPQPGYGAQPGYPPAPGYAPPPSAPANGVLSWALGFLVFIPIPFLGAFVSGIVMASVYGSVSSRGPLARENARAAANWGLTFTFASTVLLVTHFILLFVLTGGGGVRDFYPLGIPITLYALMVVLHIVLVIVGTVRASQGKVTSVAVAIPFIRR